jgi:hypothetical protein
MIGGPVPRKQRVEVGQASEKLIEHVFHVQPDVEVVPQSAAGKRDEPRIALAAGNTSSEQPVFSSDRHLLHQLFSFIVVDRDRRIDQVTLQLDKVVADVLKRFGEIALRQDHVGCSRLHLLQP